MNPKNRSWQGTPFMTHLRMMSDKTAFTSWQYIKAVCTGTSASAVPYSPLHYVYGKDHGS